MKFLSFRVLALCLALPPILYFLSLSALEHHAKRRYETEIPNIYLGDTAALLAGEVRLKDAVRANIENYLDKHLLSRLGMNVEVTVVTETGVLIYPAVFSEDTIAIDYMDLAETARENFRLLNERPAVLVDVGLRPASPLSVGILAIYLLMGAGGLGWHLRKGLRRADARDLETRLEMDRLMSAQQATGAQLAALEETRQSLAAQLERTRQELENQKRQAGDTEEQMLGELLAVEEELARKAEMQAEKELRIEALRQDLKAFEQVVDQSERRKQKDAAALLKRFNALYKNVVVQERAVRGFMDLTDEMQLKAEEVIHLLNDDPDKVAIKRKVFGKKTTSTSLEVIFAYKGRLYFRKTPAQGVEVLVIGTKNSQGRDLGYLQGL